jgi:hypothetical protein
VTGCAPVLHAPAARLTASAKQQAR